jgi:hypothetical protein
VADGGKILKLGSGQGEFVFHAVWLRKNCHCSECFFSSNGHTGRKIFPHELDPFVTMMSAEISGMLLRYQYIHSECTNKLTSSIIMIVLQGKE